MMGARRSFQISLRNMFSKQGYNCKLSKIEVIISLTKF